MAWPKKRLYRTAEVVSTDDGFAVALDGRSVKTPIGAPFVVPTEALATAVAEEFLAQGDTIAPDTMPTTRLVATAIDRVGPMRSHVIDQLAAYAQSDLLCYRAEEPEELVTRQVEHWQPLLDWAVETLGARFAVTQGVMPVSQPPNVAEAVRGAIEALDGLELTALSSAVQACGSVVVGLALLRGRIDDEGAFAIAELDESFQIERWGEVDDAANRRQRLRADLHAAAVFLALAREEDGAGDREERKT